MQKIQVQRHIHMFMIQNLYNLKFNQKQNFFHMGLFKSFKLRIYIIFLLNISTNSITFSIAMQEGGAGPAFKKMLKKEN